ncbi:S-layer homology domain-containing protein [Saccharibacillus kuerlensis]|uniref:S-layer homology domain-containing protein n=1 Tax=Saccharibacillus kuerlensis TaxID=459527 RepID=UPI003570ADC1
MWDIDKASTWTINSVGKAQSLDLLSGRGANQFAPLGTTNRAESMSVMDALLNRGD